MGKPGLYRWMLFLAAMVLLGGCATTPKTAGPRPPRLGYEPLRVRNSCFVESVHFYDTYLRKRGAEDGAWARVLQWGNQEGDFKISSGHAVTVFTEEGRLWYYDINFGVLPIDLPVDRRGDLTEVSPRVFSRYPAYRPIFARYREDYPQIAPKKPAEYLFYHANPDVRDATRVASELGRHRPVRVVEFEMTDKGKKQTSAVAAFLFQARPCLYFPRHGTHVSAPRGGDVQDLRYIARIVKRVYPSAENVRWQPGGYWLFPPKEKGP